VTTDRRITVLMNGSFEGEYVQHEGTVLVAPGWVPFWSLGDPPQEKGQGPCAMPEYKALPTSVDARRVADGDVAQCWFLNWKVMDAGVYQVVGVKEGEWYRFSALAQAWCDKGNDPRVSRGEMYVALGIDPYGRQEPFGMGVLWSRWEWVGPEHLLLGSPIVQAQKAEITVMVRAWNKWKLRHNDVYVDAAALDTVELGGGGPDPGPGTGVDYVRIQDIVREELKGRAPVRWP
jgi:hypothetical protein